MILHSRSLLEKLEPLELKMKNHIDRKAPSEYRAVSRFDQNVDFVDKANTNALFDTSSQSIHAYMHSIVLDE